MDQEPIPLSELLAYIAFLGSATFALGAACQTYLLYLKKTKLFKALLILLITRVFTIATSFLLWGYWPFPIDIMWLFLFLPALIPEIITNAVTTLITGHRFKASSNK